jgi:hypothetical protein
VNHLNNKNLNFHSSRARKSKIKIQQGFVANECCLLGLPMVIFSLWPHGGLFLAMYMERGDSDLLSVSSFENTNPMLLD